MPWFWPFETKRREILLMLHLYVVWLTELWANTWMLYKQPFVVICYTAIEVKYRCERGKLFISSRIIIESMFTSWIIKLYIFRDDYIYILSSAVGSMWYNKRSSQTNNSFHKTSVTISITKSDQTEDSSSTSNIYIYIHMHTYVWKALDILFAHYLL